MAVIDVNTMVNFAANLGTFNKAINASNAEIEGLLNRPGIESEEITNELTRLKTKLTTLSATWEQLATDFNKHLNISLWEAEKTQQQIQATLETDATPETK